jgi:hypothetical protein
MPYPVDKSQGIVIIDNEEGIHMEIISEVKLARVHQYFTDLDRTAALLTAFRGEYTREENQQRNRTLAAEIRKLGYGYVFVDGYWVENLGRPDEVRVS